MDGQWVEDDVKAHNFNKAPLEKLLGKSGCKLEKLMLVTLDEDGRVLIQEENKAYFTANIAKEDVYNE